MTLLEVPACRRQWLPSGGQRPAARPVRPHVARHAQGVQEISDVGHGALIGSRLGVEDACRARRQTALARPASIAVIRIGQLCGR